MSKSSSIYIGMYVHKESINIAMAGADGRGEVRHYGTIGRGLAALDRAVRKFASSGCTLHFVYEAGPCGYTIYRHLAVQGYVATAP